MDRPKKGFERLYALRERTRGTIVGDVVAEIVRAVDNLDRRLKALEQVQKPSEANAERVPPWLAWVE